MVQGVKFDLPLAKRIVAATKKVERIPMELAGDRHNSLPSETSFWAKITGVNAASGSTVATDKGYSWKRERFDTLSSTAQANCFVADHSPEVTGTYTAFSLSGAPACIGQIVRLYFVGCKPNSTTPIYIFDEIKPYELFPVWLSQDGGTAGTRSAYCSYTYTVKPLDTLQTLATAASPITSPARMLMVACYAATRGMAYVDENKVTKLYYAQERIAQSNFN